MRGDHRVLESIGKSMITTMGDSYQFIARGEQFYDNEETVPGTAGGGPRNYKSAQSSGKYGGKGDKSPHRQKGGFLLDTPMGVGPRGRLRAIPNGMSKELRHANRPTMKPDGYMPLMDLLDTDTMQDSWTSQKDIIHVVKGP